MAAVIGEFGPEPSRFQAMIANPPLQQQQHQHQSQHQHQHHQHQRSHDSSSFRSPSRSRRSPAQRTSERADRGAAYASPATPPSPTAGHQQTHVSGGGGASRIPSPPSSSSPAVATGPAAADDGSRVSMASQLRDPVPLGHPATATATATAASHLPVASDPSATHHQQPSPPAEDFAIAAPAPGSYLTSAATPTSTSPPQTVVHVRDLAHVQSLARNELLVENAPGELNDPPLQQTKYEISAMPIGDIIEMVAALLTKITTTNDLQHDAMSRNVTHQQQANQSADGSGSSHMSPLSHSVLAFHGKNVPAITILSYLSRIHKYCPTTYEVFLSLLVYFDRMTERVNELVTKSEEARRTTSSRTAPSPSQRDRQQQDSSMRDVGDAAAASDESDSDLADDSDDEMGESPAAPSRPGSGRIITAPDQQSTVNGPATYFVVDSFNIHRLIIAGITCASKFFSDVFYTNSRYAKVGGLPLAELNHLEIQFLLLNEFRLAVPVEDLEAYATMLVEFYAREVVAQRPAPEAGQ